MCTCTCTYIYTYRRVCTHTRMHARTHAHLSHHIAQELSERFVCMYVRTLVYTYVSKYLKVCMHTHIRHIASQCHSPKFGKRLCMQACIYIHTHLSHCITQSISNICSSLPKIWYAFMYTSMYIYTHTFVTLHNTVDLEYLLVTPQNLVCVYVYKHVYIYTHLSRCITQSISNICSASYLCPSGSGNLEYMYDVYTYECIYKCVRIQRETLDFTNSG